MMNWYIIFSKLSFNVKTLLLVNGIFHNRVHPNRSSHSLGFFLVWEDQRSRGLRFCGDCGVCWVSTFSRMLCGCHNCSSPILDKKKKTPSNRRVKLTSESDEEECLAPASRHMCCSSRHATFVQSPSQSDRKICTNSNGFCHVARRLWLHFCHFYFPNSG